LDGENKGIQDQAISSLKGLNAANPYANKVYNALL